MDWDGLLSRKPVDTLLELGAYEHLWRQPDASTKRIAKLFEGRPGALPSEFVDEAAARDAGREVAAILKQRGVKHYGVRVHGMLDYPVSLRDASEPIELLYYIGSWELAEAPRRVAVVGTRKPSLRGAVRTRKLVRGLVESGCTIVSGLAKGVDTIAHETAIASGGQTFAVIGTPITDTYPKSNAALQARIGREYLLISQVPILRYASQTYQDNRRFFPERNKTMSALTSATIIVEATETSGALVQARAALDQGRQLFILASNFENSAITWPARFEQDGAHRVHDLDDIVTRLL